MKRNKLSTAILDGYSSNGGKQCINFFRAPDGSMCIWGAYLEAVVGDPEGDDADFHALRERFEKAWGIDIVHLNNNSDEERATEPFPWEHIYGMARAAGL